MILLKKVSAIQVRRAFVAANDTRGHKKEKRAKLSKEEFQRNFAKAKRRVQKLNSAQLDRIIGKEYMKRRDAYNQMQWYLGTAKVGEIAVWHGAGGLPEPWTSGSLSATAKKVSLAIQKRSK